MGPKRDEATGEWRKLHNEELNDLDSSPNIVWVIKLRSTSGRGMQRAWGMVKVYTGLWWVNLKERDYLEDPSVDGSSGSGI